MFALLVDSFCVGYVVPAVFNGARRHIKSVSSRQRQLFHSRATEHNVTVCREDLRQTR